MNVRTQVVLVLAVIAALLTPTSGAGAQPRPPSVADLPDVAPFEVGQALSAAELEDIQFVADDLGMDLVSHKSFLICKTRSE